MKRTLILAPLVLLAACGALPARQAPPPGSTAPSVSVSSSPVSPASPVPEFDISATMIPAGSVAPSSVLPSTTLSLAMVLLDDDGKRGKKLGCGDSIAFVEKQVPHTVEILNAALTELFAIRTETYGPDGATNSLTKSQLELRGANVSSDGIATVRLSGTVTLGGTCDSPRVMGQVEETILAVPGVKSVVIELNGSATAWKCSFDASGLPPCNVPLPPTAL